MKVNRDVRNTTIFWGVALILAAICLILSSLNVFSFDAYGLSPWKLFLAVLCVGWVAKVIADKTYPTIFLPLAGLFLLFEDMIAILVGRKGEVLVPVWIVILSAVLLMVGVGMVIPKNKRRFIGIDTKHIGESEVYLNAETDLSDAHVEDVAGYAKVYITNKEKYPGHGRLRIKDVAGRVVVQIPSNWLVIKHVEDCVGRVVVPGQDETKCDQVINIDCRDIAGSIEVEFVD